MSQVFIGSCSFAPPGGPPTIVIDPSTGTITGNFDINGNVNFTEPNVNATFKSLLLSDLDILPNSTADRLIVQLPNTNDTIKIAYDGRLEREASNGSAYWELGASEANNGFSFRVNTSQPNLQLYAPDSGGAVALYNSANGGYAWYLGTDGIASFNDVTHRGTSFFNGNITCNANVSIAGPLTTINGLTLLSEVNVAGNVEVGGVVNAQGLLINGVPVANQVPIPVFVNANYTVPNDQNDYELYISAGGSNIIITLPADPPFRQVVDMVIINAGTANQITVGTGTPVLDFVGGGQQSAFVNLLSAGPGGSSLANYWVQFKNIDFGPPGDWWVWTA